MNPTTLFAISVLLCGSIVALAHNAETPEWFKKLDRDGSGGISREEIPKLFDRLNVDKDGVHLGAEAGGSLRKSPCRQGVLMRRAFLVAGSTATAARFCILRMSGFTISSCKAVS